MYSTCLVYKSNGGVATTFLPVDFDDLPYPRESAMYPVFASNDRKGYLHKAFIVAIELFRMSGK